MGAGFFAASRRRQLEPDGWSIDQHQWVGSPIGHVMHSFFTFLGECGPTRGEILRVRRQMENVLIGYRRGGAFDAPHPPASERLDRSVLFQIIVSMIYQADCSDVRQLSPKKVKKRCTTCLFGLPTQG